MHPYTILKGLLQELIGRVVSEDLRPDAFGSYVATYDNGGNLIRLVWDGKDGWGFVQRHLGHGEWADVTGYLTEGDLEGIPQNHAKIEEFRQAVAALSR